MYVCLCYGISDKKLKEMVENGCNSLGELQKSCQLGKGCGICIEDAGKLVSSHKKAVNS